MRNLRIAVSSSIAVFVIVGLFVGVDLAFAVAMTVTAQMVGMPWMAELSVLWLILVFWVLPKDWMAINRTYRCRGSAVIDAPIAQVWDAVQVRPRGASYRPVVTRITPDLDDPDRFFFHFDNRLTGDGTGQPSKVAVQLVENDVELYQRYEYPQTASLPNWSRDILWSEVMLEQTDAGVRVTFIETLRRLRVPILMSLFFLNPSRDAARRLKSWVEGTEDPSWMGQFMQDLGSDGEAPAHLRAGVLVAVIAAFATLGIISFAIIRFIMSALPGG